MGAPKQGLLIYCDVSLEYFPSDLGGFLKRATACAHACYKMKEKIREFFLLFDNDLCHWV